MQTEICVRKLDDKLKDSKRPLTAIRHKQVVAYLRPLKLLKDVFTSSAMFQPSRQL